MKMLVVWAIELVISLLTRLPILYVLEYSGGFSTFLFLQLLVVINRKQH